MDGRYPDRWARGLLAVVLTFVLAIVAAALPATAAAAPEPFRICVKMGGQAGPEIAGAMVVWTDARRGNLDIYGRDLRTRKDVPVCTHKAQQDNPSVTRYAPRAGKARYLAVWVDARNRGTGDSTDIYGRDLTRGRSFVVARSATIKWFPEIVDRWVVWIEADEAGGPYRVKARDLAAGKTYRVATTKVLSPVAVDRRTLGTKTVYTTVYTSGKGDISGRDLPAGTPFVISRKSRFEWMPDISRHRVVWWEAGERVMLKNLKTGRRTFVHRGSRPRIDGERVVWDNGGHGGSFTLEYAKGAVISMRRVTRGTRIVRVAQPHLTCLFPAISGRRVVWESGPAERVLSHIHVYGARLP